MILLQGNKLERNFGGDVLFENINFSISDTSKIALVGKNGAGKSTLLKIIAGVEAPNKGEISKIKNLSMSYLAQDSNFSSDKTIYEEMLTSFSQVIGMEKELRRMEVQMSELLGSELESLMGRYDSLTEEFRAKNGFTYDSEIRSVLNGFKFPEDMWDMKITSLSGGQKTRLALAKMLVEYPDLLILDEPTNHLDIDTLSWLENYLKNYRGALLIVSHDRYFLDKVVNETFELSRGELTRYAGNYSKYVELRAEKLARELKEFEKQQKEIANLEDFVNRNIARASTTKRAQSRRKQLEKMSVLDKPVSQDKSVNFAFIPEKESGNVVLKVDDAAIGYDGEIMSEPVDFEERKFDSIAIVGENGVGKTTLIRSIIGQVPFIKGQASLGANVMLGYYDQEQKDLTKTNTVLEELWNENRLVPEADIRTRLGSFLFSGNDVEKTVGMLSGGEKARLLLAKLSMKNDNFLVLDEPTNHLDIDSREVLESALVDFEGTLLFVSHDRYFINKLATKVLELTPDGSKIYLGDYDYYLEKKAEEAALKEIYDQENTQVKTQILEEDDYKLQKEAQRYRRKLERDIASCEEKMASNDSEIESINESMLVEKDHLVLIELQASLDQLALEQEDLMESWTDLMEDLDQLA
ncbi:ABC-F family ATP-binding cassette domain-containing protein [Streptococcaceae bacterium ESL0687]|nr:ABC-F family ATP-binding cassette domain-containing protein [Streptococcaceae bacterium ESL0687]